MLEKQLLEVDGGLAGSDVGIENDESIRVPWKGLLEVLSGMQTYCYWVIAQGYSKHQVA